MVIPVFSLARDYHTAFCLQLPDRFLACLKGVFYDLHCTVPCDGIHMKNAVLRSLGALSSVYVFIKDF